MQYGITQYEIQIDLMLSTSAIEWIQLKYIEIN